MVFTVSKAVATNNRLLVTDVSGGTGAEWKIMYDLRDPKATFIELDYVYTKDTSTKFTIKNAHTIYETKLTDEYAELIVDSDGKTLPLTYTVEEEGKFFLFLPIGFTGGALMLTIKPDVAGGNDTLVIHVQEQYEQKRR